MWEQKKFGDFFSILFLPRHSVTQNINTMTSVSTDKHIVASFFNEEKALESCVCIFSMLILFSLKLPCSLKQLCRSWRIHDKVLIWSSSLILLMKNMRPKEVGDSCNMADSNLYPQWYFDFGVLMSSFTLSVKPWRQNSVTAYFQFSPSFKSSRKPDWDNYLLSRWVYLASQGRTEWTTNVGNLGFK